MQICLHFTLQPLADTFTINVSVNITCLIVDKLITNPEIGLGEIIENSMTIFKLILKVLTVE